MNPSRCVPALSAVALAVACSDGVSPEPGLEPEQAAATYAIELGTVNTGHTTGSAGGLDLSAPAVGAGDVLIAQVVVARLNGTSMAPAHVICAPAGWQSIRRTGNRAENEVSEIAQETFVFVATAAAAAASHQWSFRAGSCTGTAVEKAASGAIARFTGVNATNPVDVHAGNVGTGNPPFATPNVVTTVNGAHVLRLVGVQREAQVSFDGVATAYSVGSSAGEQRSAAVGDFSQGMAGPTGPGWFRFGPEGPGVWTGQTIALRPAHELKVRIHDTFSRASAAGWGAADVGGPWSVSRPGFQVDGGAGILDAVGDSSVYVSVARVPTSYGLNVVGLTSFRIDRTPDGGSPRFHTVQVYARRNDRDTDGDNYYRYRVRVFGSNVMDLRIEKSVNAVTSQVTDSVKLATTFAPGAKYWIRWEALGTSPATTVRMRVWPDGAAEPTSWQASAVVDERGLDFPGTSGFRFQAPTVQLTWPVRFVVDDFLYAER